jgi:hypothetical protein
MNRLSVFEPKVEHREGRGVRSCPIFPELRPILDEAFEIFGDKSEYVVAAPQYRAAANTAMGWKNSNLRTEMTRLLRRAGVSGWPRLFHTIKLQEGRASRRAEGGGGGVSASLSRHFLSRGVRSALATASRPHVADADVTMTLHEEEFFALWAAKARELVTINCPKYHPSNCKCRGTD